MTDPIRAALERLIARLDETTDPSGPVPAWSDSFYAARAALAQPAPFAEGEVAHELTDQELLRCAKIATPCYDLKAWERELRMMRAAIALDRSRRAPGQPAEGDVGELVRQLRTKAATEKANRCHYSAILLTPNRPPLSPAAQVVLDAWLKSENGERMLGDPACLAVALRAAADQVVPEADTNRSPCREGCVIGSAPERIRHQFLAIANELDPQP